MVMGVMVMGDVGGVGCGCIIIVVFAFITSTTYLTLIRSFPSRWKSFTRTHQFVQAKPPHYFLRELAMPMSMRLTERLVYF